MLQMGVNCIICELFIFFNWQTSLVLEVKRQPRQKTRKSLNSRLWNKTVSAPITEDRLGPSKSEAVTTLKSPRALLGKGENTESSQIRKM